MSNYMEDEIRNLLALINWGQQSWEAVTFKMLEGGNQVIERRPPIWDPNAVPNTSTETIEHRICGNLDNENLAQFIARAPSILSDAQNQIESLERDIEKLTKKHVGETFQLKRDIENSKQKYDILKGVVENQTDQIDGLKKKLTRYEKKRKKGGKK